MSISLPILLLMLGCALVTWVPRVVPFILVRNLQLPDVVLRWLAYIPVCILSALVLESLFEAEDHFVTFDWLNLFAFIPTIAVAIWTKSLSKTVIVGVITMAIIRLFI